MEEGYFILSPLVLTVGTLKTVGLLMRTNHNSSFIPALQWDRWTVRELCAHNQFLLGIF